MRGALGAVRLFAAVAAAVVLLDHDGGLLRPRDAQARTHLAAREPLPPQPLQIRLET